MLAKIGVKTSAMKIAFAESAEAIGLTTAQLSAFLGVAAGIAVIAGTIGIIAAATTSYKEAREEWQASAQAYEDSASRVQSLEDELTDVSKKIDDINAKDKIDPTDREALDNLKKTKLNLEEQLELEKKLASYRQAKAAKDAKTAIDKGGSAAWDKESVFGIKGVEDIDYINAGVKIKGRSAQGLHLDRYDQISETSAVQNAIDRLIKERQDLEDNYRLYIDSMSESEQNANRDRVAKIDDLVTNLQEKAATNMAEIQEYLGSITDADGNALQGYEDYVFRIEQLQHQISGVEVDPLDDAIAHVKEFQQLAKDDNWDSAELRHYIGLLSGQDLSTADVEKVQEAWKALKQTIGDSDWNVFNFLQGDETNNLQQFWESVQSINSEWASFDQKTGEWTINITSVEALADELGLSEDLVNSIIKKTSEAGIDIDTTPVDNVRHAIMETSDALDVLKSKKVGIDFNLDSKTVQEAEQGIDHVAKYLASLRDDKGKLNLDSEEVQAAYTILSQLYDKKMELSNAEDITFRVNTEGISDDKIKTFITDVNNAKTAIQELQKGQKLKAQGFDIDVGELKKKAKEAVGTVQESFKELPEDKKVKLSITEEGVNSEHLGKTLKVLQQINEADCTVALGIDPALVEGYDPDDKEAEVKYSANYDAVTKSTPPTMRGKVEYRSDYTHLSTPPGVGKGTASRTHFQGTANASGTWGSNHDGDDLVGELGRELRVNVRTGRWETIGDNGAEFTHIGKGDIIFNHKQTEQLLKYGHINSRGRALASGNAYDIGVTGKGVLGSPKPKDNDKSDSEDTGKREREQQTKAIKDAAKAVSNAASSVADESSKTADWVEQVLKDIDEKTSKYISRAEKKAENGNYSGAARQYQKAQNAYAAAMSKQKDASGVYASQANKILADAVANGTITKEQSASIQNKVAHGAMELVKLSDGVEKVVSSYQEYYNKAQDAADATQELYDKYEELAEKMYQLPLDAAKAKTEKLEKEFTLLEKKLELTTNAAKRESLMRQELANMHKQLAAQYKAEEQAAENYRNARRKINELGDSALRGLSDTQKNSVLRSVQNKQTVDYTSLIGLTDEGRRAIIDYNAALSAQVDALYEAQMALLDHAQKEREIAADIANQPLEQAEGRKERRHKADDTLNAEYDVETDVGKKNKKLLHDDRATQKDIADFEQAEADTTKKLKKAWKTAGVQAALQTDANAGKVFGQKLSGAGFKEGSKELQQIRQYNAWVDAQTDAQLATRKAKAEGTKQTQDNAAERLNNIVAEENQKINDASTALEKAQDGFDQLGNTLNAINQAETPAAKAALQKKFEETYGVSIDPSQNFEANAAAIQTQIAGYAQEKADAEDAAARRIEAGIKREGDNLSAEQQRDFEEQIYEFRKAGRDDEEAAAEAQKQANEYDYQASPEQYNYRAAQEQYNQDQYSNEYKVAAGMPLTLDDQQSIINDIYGYTDETGAQIEGLLSQANAEVERLRTNLAQCVPGTEEYEETAKKLEEAEDYAKGLASAGEDAKSAFNDLSVQEFKDELEDLQNEAEKLKDKNELYSAMGLGNNPGVDLQLIANSQQQVALLEQHKAKLLEQRAALDPLSDKYKQITQDINACDDAIRQAKTDQAGWKQEAMSTAVGAVGNISNSLSSMFGSIASAASAWKEFFRKLIKKIDDWKRWQVNKAYIKISKIESRLSSLQTQLEIKKELGENITAADYLAQIEQNAELINTYRAQLIPKLQDDVQEKSFYAGLSISEENSPHADPDGSKYKAALEELNNAWSTLENLQQEQLKLMHSAAPLALLEPLEKAKKYVSEISSILRGVNDLITDDMLYDAEGKLSKHGQQHMAMLAGEYRTTQQELETTLNMIRGLQNRMNAGKINQDDFASQMADQQDELVKGIQKQRDIALDMAEAMREASEKELASLQEIIDARRDALKAKKDYYDYDKNIRTKTKDIQALQAQIAALAGLADAESKAKKAKLEAELQTAQDDLRDTINDHMFDLSDKSLENLSEALEDAHQEQWDAVISSIDELVKFAQEYSDKYSDQDVYDAFQQVLEGYGLEFNVAGDNDVSMFSTLFKDALAAINKGEYAQDTYLGAIENFNKLITGMQSQGLMTDEVQITGGRDDAALLLGALGRATTENPVPTENKEGTTYSWRDQWHMLNSGNNKMGVVADLLLTFKQLKLWYQERQADKGNAEMQAAAEQTAKELVETAQKYQQTHIYGNRSLWSLLAARTRDDGSFVGVARGDNPDANSATQDSKTTNLWQDIGESIKSGWDNLVSGIKGLFGGHAAGSKRIKRDEWAWTQEGHKEEWIVRQSDGAILTPLSKGDGVLPANLTSRLWDLATGNLPSVQPTMPSFSIPDMNISENFSPHVTQTFESLLTVNGNVDATVIDDLKQFTKDLASNKELLESAYKYTSEQMYRGFLHSGGKRRS